MSTPTFVTRQAPGWWSGLIITRCKDCGWESRVLDLTVDSRAEMRAQRDHECEAHPATKGSSACGCGSGLDPETCAYLARATHLVWEREKKGS